MRVEAVSEKCGPTILTNVAQFHRGGDFLRYPETASNSGRHRVSISGMLPTGEVPTLSAWQKDHRGIKGCFERRRTLPDRIRSAPIALARRA